MIFHYDLTDEVTGMDKRKEFEEWFKKVPTLPTGLGKAILISDGEVYDLTTKAGQDAAFGRCDPIPPDGRKPE